MFAWSVKTPRSPSRHCRDARADDLTTTAVHGVEYTPSPHRTNLEISPGLTYCERIRTETVHVRGTQVIGTPSLAQCITGANNDQCCGYSGQCSIPLGVTESRSCQDTMWGFLYSTHEVLLNVSTRVLHAHFVQGEGEGSRPGRLCALREETSFEVFKFRVRYRAPRARSPGYIRHHPSPPCPRSYIHIA